MATKEKTLSDAFYETLKDIYYAEKQSVRALGKSAKAAKSSELKQAFEHHREESSGQVERLEQVFEILGKPARAKTCEAMKGLQTEMEEDLEDFGDTPAGDAVLIGCAQAVEHYEIARYGMLKTWAAQLGMGDAAKLLDETLQEEKDTDALLTRIAERAANAEAGEGEGKVEDDEEEGGCRGSRWRGSALQGRGEAGGEAQVGPQAGACRAEAGAKASALEPRRSAAAQGGRAAARGPATLGGWRSDAAATISAGRADGPGGRARHR